MNARTGIALLTVAAVSTLALATLATNKTPSARAPRVDARIASAAAVGGFPSSALGRARVERGRYLVNAIGCADCHSPKIMGEHGPVPDESRHLIGHPEGSDFPAAPTLPPDSPWIAVGAWDLTAWSGPWGTSYAANLTPDVNTGLGIWTEDMFVRALRTGRHMGQSRPILPPMPWEAFRHFSDEDLGAIYAYLRTIPPVHNRVPEPLPPPGQEPEDPFAG